MTTLKNNYGPLVIKLILFVALCFGPAKFVLPWSGVGTIFVYHAALAKGGDGGGDGGGGSGSGDSGSDGDGDSGSSGPGSGSDSGSDGEGDSDSSGPGSGSDSDSDSDNSGSGKDNGDSSQSSNSAEESDRGGFDPGNFIDLLKASLYRGTVVKKRKSRSLLEITYRDGWKEKIVSGRYILLDPKNRIVVKRTATRADTARMKAAFKSKSRWAPPETRN